MCLIYVITYTVYAFTPSTAKTTTNLTVNSLLESQEALNIATLITALAALATSYMSYATLRESKKQRDLANTPKLHILTPKNKIPVENIKFNGVDKELPIGWVSEDIKRPDNTDFPPIYSMPLKLINIGMSPAVNVKINWDYKNIETLKDISKMLNELNLGIECVFSVSNGVSWISLITKYLELDVTRIIKNNNILNSRYTNIDLIKHYSVPNDEIEIMIPEPFLLFINLVSIIKSFSVDHNDVSAPSLDVKITYDDNINVSHEDNFSIKFSHSCKEYSEYSRTDGNYYEFKITDFLIKVDRIDEKN